MNLVSAFGQGRAGVDAHECPPAGILTKAAESSAGRSGLLSSADQALAASHTSEQPRPHRRVLHEKSSGSVASCPDTFRVERSHERPPCLPVCAQMIEKDTPFARRPRLAP